MNADGIYSTAKLSHGASVAELLGLEDQLKAILPLEYKQFLQITNGADFASGVVIYPAGEVYEVNGTYAVAEYLPGYLAIGDDSGGQFVVIPYAGEGFMLSVRADWMKDLLKYWLSLYTRGFKQGAIYRKAEMN